MFRWMMTINLLLLQCSMSSATAADLSTLQVVNVIYRHGDRAPTAGLPIDRYNESFWPYGYGELTDIGKEQQYRLGKYFRGRYQNFIGDKYNPKEIFVRSSDVDRCLVSAYSDLAGLFSNASIADDVALPFINWQPVPAHSIPVELDELLAMQKPCRAVDVSKTKIFNTDYVKAINSDYKEFFEYLMLVTGVNLTENAFRDIWVVHDTLFCESQHNGGELPAWADFKNITCHDSHVLPCDGLTAWEILTKMADLQFYVMYNSTVLHRFEGGPLLEDIAAKLNAFVAKNQSIRFNMFSAHDTTVAAVLNALGVFDKKAPQYTATVIIELHKIAAGHEVKVFYKDVTNSNDTHQLQLPACQSPCSLQSFTKLVDQYKILDWDRACGNVETTTPTKHTAKGLTEEEIVVITICGSIVVVLALTAVICHARRKKISHSYVPIQA